MLIPVAVLSLPALCSLIDRADETLGCRWRRVLVASDMLSDVLIPMLDPNDTADPIEDYLAALRLLEGVAGDVDVVVPGHGSIGGTDQAHARIDQDRAYVRALRDAQVPSDPRAGPSARDGKDWLPDVHARELQHLARRTERDGTPGSRSALGIGLHVCPANFLTQDNFVGSAKPDDQQHRASHQVEGAVQHEEAHMAPDAGRVGEYEPKKHEFEQPNENQDQSRPSPGAHEPKSKDHWRTTWVDGGQSPRA
jgi:hypothetical protein